MTFLLKLSRAKTNCRHKRLIDNRSAVDVRLSFQENLQTLHIIKAENLLDKRVVNRN